MDDNTILTTKTIALEIKQRGLATYFDPEVIIKGPGDSGGGYIADVLSRSWSATLKAHIPYNHLWTYMKPRNWREAVKERWAPMWAKQRWPVVYDKLDLAELLKIAVPKNCGDRMYVVVFNGQEMAGLPDEFEMTHTWCPFCKDSVPVLVDVLKHAYEKQTGHLGG